MKKPNKRVVARQLSRAMQRRGVGSRVLSKRIHKLRGEIRGSSYGAIEAYRRGDVTNPRMEVLEALAEALNVRPEWLIWGEGEMTESEQRLAVAGSGELPPEEDPDYWRLRLDRVLPEFETLSFENRALLVAVLKRLDAAGVGRGAGRLDAAGVGRGAGFENSLIVLRQFLFAPLRSFVTSTPRTQREIDDYIRLAMSAFIQAIPEKVEELQHVTLRRKLGSPDQEEESENA